MDVVRCVTVRLLKIPLAVRGEVLMVETRPELLNPVRGELLVRLDEDLGLFTDEGVVPIGASMPG